MSGATTALGFSIIVFTKESDHKINPPDMELETETVFSWRQFSGFLKPLIIRLVLFKYLVFYLVSLSHATFMPLIPHA